MKKSYLFLSLCLFVVYPQTKKKKKKKITQYSSLQTRVLCKFFFLNKRYSSLVYSSTVLHGTRVYQARVKFQLSSAMVAKLMRNSSF